MRGKKDCPILANGNGICFAIFTYLWNITRNFRRMATVGSMPKFAWIQELFSPIHMPTSATK